MERALPLLPDDLLVRLVRPGQGPCEHKLQRPRRDATKQLRVLAREAIVCSMSRSGNCWDTAVVESFFGTLKTELPATEWPTRAAATAAVTDYIDAFYNPRRRHSSLDYLSPVDFELRLARQRATA